MTVPATLLHHTFETATLDEFNDDGTELVVDSDMAAPTAAAYTPGNSAILSKVPNGEGGQALRVEADGASVPYATQAGLMTNNEWYNFLTRTRGDGAENGYFRTIASPGADIFPLPSTDWKEYAYSGYGASALLVAGVAQAAGHHDYDYISIKRQQKRYLDQSGNGHHCILGDGAALSTLPTILRDKGVHFEATGRHCRILDPFASTTAISVSALIRNPAGTAAIQDIVSARTADNFLWITLLPGSNLLGFYTGGESGVNGALATIPDNRHDSSPIHVTGVHEPGSTKIYINGVLAGTATTPLAPVYSGQDLYFGMKEDGSRPWLGKLYSVKAWPIGTALTADQVNENYRNDLSQYGRSRS